MGIKERLREVRGFLKLSQEALAVEMGAQRTTVAGYESGISLPRAEFLRELSVKYKINSNWILTGQGSMLNEASEKSRLEQDLEAVISAQVAPQFAGIEARLTALERRLGEEEPAGNPYPEEAPAEGGGFTAEPEPEYGTEERDWVPYVRDIAAGPPIRQADDQGQRVAVPVRLLKKGGRYYAASVRGTSMTEAGIRDGDTVLIRCAAAPREGAIQVVRHRGRRTLKRLREVAGKGWELHYEDGTGRVIPVDSGQYEVQGEFTAVLPENCLPD
jgi:SOS-response transcriptional repressor LexA